MQEPLEEMPWPEGLKVEIVYGWRVERPEWQCKIIEPPPLRWYQVLWYGFLDLWYWVIVPAFLFALSFTCFLYAVKFAFR